MPYAKRRYRRRKAKPKRKKKVFNVNRGIVSKTFRQTHRYATAVAIDPVIASIGGKVFSCNGLYDPDISGVGHQPYLFDQMVLLYNHYTVINARMRATFFSKNNNASTSTYLVGVQIRSGTTITGTPSTMIEQGESNWSYLSQGDGSKSLVTVTKKINLSRWLNQKVLEEDGNAGTAGANPFEEVYFHVFACAADFASNPDSLTCQITIEYDTVWHEKKALTGS